MKDEKDSKDEKERGIEGNVSRICFDGESRLKVKMISEMRHRPFKGGGRRKINNIKRQEVKRRLKKCEEENGRTSELKLLNVYFCKLSDFSNIAITILRQAHHIPFCTVVLLLKNKSNYVYEERQCK